VDECDKLAQTFEVASLPTFLFLRGGATKQHVVGTINGGGPQFLPSFSSMLTKNSKEYEINLLRKYLQRSSPDMSADSSKGYEVSQEEVETLAHQPLKDMASFVVHRTREDLGIAPVRAALAFDISHHEAAKTPVADSILRRIKDDVALFADVANHTAAPKLANMTDSDLQALFVDHSGTSLAGTDLLAAAIDQARAMLKKLNSLHSADLQFVENIVPLLEKVANFVDGEAESEGYFSKMPDSDLRKDKIIYLLKRNSGQRSSVWVEFLFGVLLSSKGTDDLLKLNPYLPASIMKVVMNVVSVAMLRANRLGLINRCVASVISLEQLLKKV
jgi:hypothetical protein